MKHVFYWLGCLALCCSTLAQQALPTAALATVADLAVRAPKVGEIVMVGGYATNGDWGAPKPFSWTPGATGTSEIRRATSKSVSGLYVHPWDGDVTAFGVQCDGQTDDSLALSNACAGAVQAGIGTLTLPDGTGIVKNFALGSGILLRGKGTASTRLRLPPGSAPDDHVLRIEGVATATTSVPTTDIAEGATNITLLSASGFTLGAVVRIEDDADRVPDNQGDNVNINRVSAIAGNVLTLENPVIGDYLLASNAIVTVLTNAAFASIRDLSVAVPTGQWGGGIRVRNGYYIVIDSVDASGGNDDPCISIENSGHVTVRNSHVYGGQNVGSGGFGYGFAVGNGSHDIEISDNRSSFVREDTITGGATYVTYARNHSVGAWDSGINTHAAGCRHIFIFGNTISRSRTLGIGVGFGTGADARDHDVVVQGNVISYAGTHGIQVAGVAITPYRTIVRGNTIMGWGTTVASTSGILVLGSSNVVVEANTIDGAGISGAQGGVSVFNSTNVIVQANVVEGLLSSYGIRWQACNGLLIRENTVRDTGSYPLHGDTNSQMVVAIGNICALNTPPSDEWTLERYLNRFGEGHLVSDILEATRLRGSYIELGSVTANAQQPLRAVVSTNGYYQVPEVRNTDNGSSASSGGGWSSGSGTNAASGGLIAASGGFGSSHYRNSFALIANSDAERLVFGALGSNHNVEFFIGTSAYQTLGMTNGYARLRNSLYGEAYLPYVILQLITTNAVFLPPRLSKAQRDAMSGDVSFSTLHRGGEIYQTDSGNWGPRWWTGTNWAKADGTLDP
jgi:hypothetical protein